MMISLKSLLYYYQHSYSILVDDGIVVICDLQRNILAGVKMTRFAIDSHNFSPHYNPFKVRLFECSLYPIIFCKET
jgi:hypothetical protein